MGTDLELKTAGSPFEKKFDLLFVEHIVVTNAIIHDTGFSKPCNLFIIFTVLPFDSFSSSFLFFLSSSFSTLEVNLLPLLRQRTNVVLEKYLENSN